MYVTIAKSAGEGTEEGLEEGAGFDDRDILTPLRSPWRSVELRSFEAQQHRR